MTCCSQQTRILHKTSILSGFKKDALIGRRFTSLSVFLNLEPFTQHFVYLQEGVGDPSAGNPRPILCDAVRSCTWSALSHHLYSQGPDMVLLRYNLSLYRTAVFLQ